MAKKRDPLLEEARAALKLLRPVRRKLGLVGRDGEVVYLYEDAQSSATEAEQPVRKRPPRRSS